MPQREPRGFVKSAAQQTCEAFEIREVKRDGFGLSFGQRIEWCREKARSDLPTREISI
jgi:hypothetical protein